MKIGKKFFEKKLKKFEKNFLKNSSLTITNN